LQGALVRAFEPFLGWAARRYQAAVADHLIKYGLRYEDLLDPINDLVRRCGVMAVAGMSTMLTHAVDLPLGNKDPISRFEVVLFVAPGHR
jgi:hypothetical protein